MKLFQPIFTRFNDFGAQKICEGTKFVIDFLTKSNFEKANKVEDFVNRVDALEERTKE